MPLKLKRRGRTWYLRGTVRGIPCYETCGTAEKDEAQALLAKRQAELYEQSVYGARAVVSFNRAAVSYLEFEGRSPKTEEYVDRLARHFGSTKLSQIDQLAADKAVSSILGRDAAPATKIRGVYGPLSAVLNHAARRGWCALIKFEHPTVPTAKTRWLSPAEALALIDAAADHLRPLFRFLLCTGARLSEALDLQWEDVDLGAAKAILRDTKNGNDRAAALPPAAIVALANIAGREGHVFRRADGEPYVDHERQAGGQIKTGWAGACRRAGIADATPHDLRHTWASWFYALTKDMLLLKVEGDWKALKMVERYAHLIPSELVGEIAQVWGPSHPRIGLLPGKIGAPSVQPAAEIAN